MMHYLATVLFLYLDIVALKARSNNPHTSVVSLEQLLKHEKRVTFKLEKYIKNQANWTVEEPIADYIKELHEITSSGTDKYVFHPINAFHLMKRCIVEWNNVAEVLRGKHKDILKTLKSYRIKRRYPRDEDLVDTLISLARVQDTYQLDLNQLQQGLIQDMWNKSKVYRSSKPMDAWDCYAVGNAALIYGFYGRAVDWITLAKDLIEGDDYSVSNQTVNLALDSAIQQHDAVLRNNGSVGPTWETYTKPFRGEETTENKDTNQQKKQFKADKSKQLCRKGSRGSTNPSLICHYLRRGEPYLLISPLKAEHKSFNPPIMVFHEFMHASEVKSFRHEAESKLSMSATVGEKIEEGGTITLDRTSKQFWVLHQDESPAISRVSRRIELATGLLVQSPDSSEPYQIVNYGVGGTFSAHVDSALPEQQQMLGPLAYEVLSNRLATFMIYLSDVPVGGETVFPNADVTVHPQKRSAVFWFNLFKSLKTNRLTEHLGCPVVYGSKWIANKWIIARAQTFNMKCGLHEDELHLLR